jgi:hypothetical protein
VTKRKLQRPQLDMFASNDAPAVSHPETWDDVAIDAAYGTVLDLVLLRGSRAASDEDGGAA